ncbi:Uncharacterised protein [Mycobacteroides abscessus subsp. abscessus]|nr:Uncharacterised protein [Mycobacteroides abscessus subsp. abscessus]
MGDMTLSRCQAARADIAQGKRQSTQTIEWGVVLDDAGSTDLYDDEQEARTAAGSGVLVKVSTTIEVVPVTTPIPGNKEATTMSITTMAECTCIYDCSNDHASRCSLSGSWHVHPDDPQTSGVFGPCPIHPDAPGDI